MGDGQKPAEETGGKRVIEVARHGDGLPFGRIALIAAAAIALVAIGFQVWKSRTPAGGATSTAAATADMPAQAGVDTMIAGLEKKLEDNPKDAEGWRMLGWSYYRTERFADAAKAYRRATEIDPNSADGWSALGEVLVLSAPPTGPAAVPDEAVAAFNRALAIDKADPRARYFLAVKKDLTGDHKGAIDDWIALLKDTPAGAPWEGNVRQTIHQVATEHKIDVSGRIPAPAAPPQSAVSEAIPGPTREQMAAASAMSPGEQDAMARGMVDSLAAKLKADPRNADGWMRLMRSYMVLGDQGAAGKALGDARTALAGDKASVDRIGDAARQLGVPGA